jgi:hypothetical protein
MRYDAFFANALGVLHDERRYRVFADLERIAGRFRMPTGTRRRVSGTSSSGAPTTISAWGSIRR